MGSGLLPVITFVYEGHWIVGVVVELPDGRWEHRTLRVEDRMNTPVPSGELVATLRPYLQPPAGEELSGSEPSAPGQP
jgi:hypothetical protein